MAWSAPTTRSHGYIVSHTVWNSDAVDNPIALRAGSIAIASQAANDLIIASSATQLARVAAAARGAVLYAGASGLPAWLAAGTSGYVLTAQGGGADPAWAVSGAVATLLRDVTATTIADTTTETTVLTGTVTGGFLSTNKMIWGVVTGSVENTSGGNLSLTLRVKYGGTTLAAPIALVGNSDGALLARFYLNALNSASVQGCVCELTVNGGNADLVGGDGGAATTASQRVTIHRTGAVDSTTDQTLAVTIQHSTATTLTRTIIDAVQVYLG